MSNKNTTESPTVGDTEIKDLSPLAAPFRKVFWEWYESLTAQQHAEHYWYQDLTNDKNTWKGKKRICHYSEEMKRYPHIQKIIQDKLDQHQKYDRRKRQQGK